MKLNNQIKTGDRLKVNLNNNTLLNETSGKEYNLKPLGDVLPIVEAGGIFDYARKIGMIG